MPSANPFRPSFGNSPPVLAGRDELIAQFAEAIDDGAGTPGRASLYTGARGTGKTVMLNEVADVARQRGWLVVEETASAGVVTRLVTQHLPALLTDLDPQARRTTVRSVTAPMGVGSIAWDSTDRHVVAAGLRNQLELTCDLLAEQGTGLLITLDEVHGSRTDDLRDLFVAVQHLFRNDRDIAVAAAGLPSAISSLLNDEVLTFLRARRPAHARSGGAARGRACPAGDDRGRRPVDRPDRLPARRGGHRRLPVPHPARRLPRVASAPRGADDHRRRCRRRRGDGADAHGVARPRAGAGRPVERRPGVPRGDVRGRRPVAHQRHGQAAGRRVGYTSVYRQRLLDAQMIEPAGHGLCASPCRG